MDNDITELNISLIDIGEEVISIKITGKLSYLPIK